VNDYLKEFDENLTSKDLRTWVANILFVKYVVVSKKKNEKNPIKSAIIRVSQQLHNTPAVCKKNYIDAKVIKYIEDKIKNDDIK
jgi:DNA topoisomerase IB